MNNSTLNRQNAQPLISVVAPFYNEDLVIDHFFRQVIDVLEATGCEWEIVCVDDGSRDRTVDGM